MHKANPSRGLRITKWIAWWIEMAIEVPSFQYLSDQQRGVFEDGYYSAKPHQDQREALNGITCAN